MYRVISRSRILFRTFRAALRSRLENVPVCTVKPAFRFHAPKVVRLDAISLGNAASRAMLPFERLQLVAGLPARRYLIVVRGEHVTELLAMTDRRSPSL